MRDSNSSRLKAQVAVGQLLSSVPQFNRAVEVEPTREGLLLTIPTQRPRWLIAPLSWLVPFSGQRHVQLDAPGKAVLELCDGTRSVEEVIERFASDNKLSFRESQLAVTQFLKQLLQRGVIALVGPASEDMGKMPTPRRSDAREGSA